MSARTSRCVERMNSVRTQMDRIDAQASYTDFIFLTSAYKGGQSSMVSTDSVWSVCSLQLSWVGAQLEQKSLGRSCPSGRNCTSSSQLIVQRVCMCVSMY